MDPLIMWYLHREKIACRKIRIKWLHSLKINMITWWILQNFRVEGTDLNNSNMEAGSVNFVGTIVCSSSIDFGNPSCECFKSSVDLWIIDSGASNHITFKKSSLTNIQTMSYPMLVSLPNGYKVKVIEFGDVVITSGIVLHNVLYVPSFKYNLVPVHSLTLSTKSVILFTSVSCLLQAPSVKRPQVLGSSREGLYFLCSRCLKNPAKLTTCCCISHKSQFFFV